MKKLILILTTLTVFGACKNNAEDTAERQLQELQQEVAIDEARQDTIDSMQAIDLLRQRTIDSMKEQQELSTAPVHVPKTVYTHSHPATGNTATGAHQPAVPTTAPVVTSPSTTTNTSTTTATPEEKKKRIKQHH